MKLGQGSVSIPGRKISTSSRQVSVPSPVSTPGTYGGPPGSFITRSRCPDGYNAVPMTKSIGSGITTEKRCVPKPTPVFRPPAPVAPEITVSPVLQQQFTPQFSPTIQQQQDSPDAAQSSVPTQTAMTPQSVPKIISSPTPAPYPDQYISPPVLPPILPRTITAPTSVREQVREPETGTNYIMPLALAAVGILFFLKEKK